MSKYVWVLLKGSSLRGEREQNVCGGKNQRIKGVFEKFDHGWSKFKKLTDYYTVLYKYKPNLRNPFEKSYLIGPIENDEGDWEFDYGFTYAGGGWITLKRYEVNKNYE
jgi:hypothetical protein